MNVYKICLLHNNTESIDHHLSQIRDAILMTGNMKAMYSAVDVLTGIRDYAEQFSSTEERQFELVKVALNSSLMSGRELYPSDLIWLTPNVTLRTLFHDLEMNGAEQQVFISSLGSYFGDSVIDNINSDYSHTLGHAIGFHCDEVADEEGYSEDYDYEEATVSDVKGSITATFNSCSTVSERYDVLNELEKHIAVLREELKK